MKTKNMIAGVFILMIILPMVSADIITPEYSPIQINNKINNIDDYPDYVFIVVSKGPMGGVLVNREINYVQEDGRINTSYYKFSQISVYAIEKSKFNEEEIKEFDDPHFEDYLSNLKNYLESINAKEVISGLDHYEERHISNPVRVENNFYIIDLSTVKTEPNNTIVERNFMIYLYILIPLTCLIIISYILIKRRNKK